MQCLSGQGQADLFSVDVAAVRVSPGVAEMWSSRKILGSK